MTKLIHPVVGNLLVVEIAAGLVGSEPETVEGINNCYPIQITDESTVHRFEFSNFVAYTVTDETFAQHADSEESS